MKTYKSFMTEKKGDTAIFTFGRFNPPTVGHEKLVVATANVARREGGEYFVYPSHSQDSKKNPLDQTTKVRYMKKMFPKHKENIIISTGKTALEIASELHDKKYTNLVMVVGSDRVKEFQSLLDRYNGDDKAHGFYDFDTIKVVSAGERDPDAEGVTGMSASKMRKAAQSNDYKSFAQGLPLGFRDGKKLFKDVQKNMRVKSFKEWTEDLEEASLLDALKIATGKKLFQNEYKEALKTYRKFRQRGDKPADALHRASSTYRHVNARELRKYIEALNPAK